MIRNPLNPNLSRPLAAISLLALALSARASGYLDLIGYNNLNSGPSILMASGAGIPVAQVEVFPTGTSNYIPDTSLDIFAGKTFTLRSGPSGVSPHATQIGGYFYSNPDGAAPNVSRVSLFSAESFVSGLLRAGRANRGPGAAGAAVINNSWVASFGNDATDTDVVRRLDDLINRDGVLVFNAVENADDGSFPRLLASSYNGVAISTLQGSRGPVNFDSKGPRIKPDLIVPVEFTSDATAIASGAGTLLWSEAKARQIPFNQLAAKAVLMAGAKRDGTWQRGAPGGTDDAVSPLDYAQGAGQLRIDRSFDILTSGRAYPQGTTGVAAEHDAAAGWDTNRTDKRTKSAVYNLSLDHDESEWSAMLTWNRIIAGLIHRHYNSTPTLADLTLSLFKKLPGRKPTLLARSDSDFDNVESLTLHDLAAGDYRLVVASNVRTRYGVAWLGGQDTAGVDSPNGAIPMIAPLTAPSIDTPAFTQVPEPTGTALLALIASGFAAQRRRRR
jgi:hypothetical protein